MIFGDDLALNKRGTHNGHYGFENSRRDLSIDASHSRCRGNQLFMRRSPGGAGCVILIGVLQQYILPGTHRTGYVQQETACLFISVFLV